MSPTSLLVSQTSASWRWLKSPAVLRTPLVLGSRGGAKTMDGTRYPREISSLTEGPVTMASAIWPSPWPSKRIGVAVMQRRFVSGYLSRTFFQPSETAKCASSRTNKSAFGTRSRRRKVSMLATWTLSQGLLGLPAIITPCSIPSLSRRFEKSVTMARRLTRKIMFLPLAAAEWTICAASVPLPAPVGWTRRTERWRRRASRIKFRSVT